MKTQIHTIIILIPALAALLLLSCGNDYNANPSIPPRITTVSPVDGATQIRVTAPIRVDFSDDIDAATVSEAAFYLIDSVAAHYVMESRAAVMIPDDSLAYSTTYTVVVTRGIRGKNGEPLESGKTWSFTTGPRPLVEQPPVITSFSPVTAYIGATVTVTGHNFWWLAYYNRVFVNDVKATVQSADSTHIVFTVPPGATTGPVSVGTPQGFTVSADTLTVFQTGDVWSKLPAPTDYALLGVCWTGQLFVAVGNLGTILTSPDGISWTLRNSGTVNRLNDVAYGNGKVVAVGTGGTVLTSPDGINWQPQMADTSLTLSAIVYGDRFITVGATGVVLRSPDAISWMPTTPFTGEWLYDIGYTGSAYVAVGHDGVLATSNTATSWRVRGPFTTEHLLAAGQFGHLTIVAGYDGTILTSADLATWTEQTSGTTAHLGGISNIDNQIVVVGDEGTILTSFNGTDWQMRDSQTHLPLYRAAWSGERLVVVGDSGCIVVTPYVPGKSPGEPSGVADISAF